MKKLFKFGCLGILSLIALMVVIVAIAPDPEPTVAAEPIAQNLAVLLPTVTPTPVPEPTPGFVATDEEQAYSNELMKLLDAYAESMDNLGTRFTTAGNDPTLFFDQDWIVSVGISVAIIELSNEEVRGLNAPPRLADVHADLLIMADHYDRSMALLTTGIDNMDVPSLLEGQTELLDGTEAMNRALAKFAALQ